MGDGQSLANRSVRLPLEGATLQEITNAFAGHILELQSGRLFFHHPTGR